MPVSSKAKSFNAKPKKTSDSQSKTQQKSKVKKNVPAASHTKKKQEPSTLSHVMSQVEKYLLDRLWDCFPQPVKFLSQVVKSYFPKIAFMATIVFFIAWNFFVSANIGHRVAIHSLKPTLKHEIYERTAEVNQLVNDLDQLRRQNPRKEIHVIISGGPGAGKSELARQLGERIYNKENYIYDIYWLRFDLSFLFPPKDVITLDANNLQLLQRSLEDAIGNAQGKEPTDIRHQGEVNEDRIFTKFHQLRVALRNRSSIWNDPVVIFDNVKARMFSFLYKRRDHGKFFLQPGNDEYGEIRIIVTTQYRPTTNFPSIIKYKYLFEPMPINESVNLLNKVSNIQNDDKNASHLAEALGGLPKALADAAWKV